MTRVSEDDRKRKKTGRLAAALRENLRRRKAQERQRNTPSAKPTKNRLNGQVRLSPYSGCEDGNPAIYWRLQTGF